MSSFDSPLDAGIERAVLVVNDAGVTTYESCEGGDGHAFPEPTVRFKGTYSEALRAVAALIELDAPVWELRQAWRYSPTGHLEGPHWDIVLARTWAGTKEGGE